MRKGKGKVNLFRLKALIDEAVNEAVNVKGIDPKEVKVKLTIAEPSNGRRSHVGVKDVYMGVDFERGELRVDPDESLIKKR